MAESAGYGRPAHNALRHVSLCSGYGGLDLAVEAVLDVETVAFAEFEPKAATVFERHWPGVPNLGDITTVDWSQLGDVDVVSGGFPCQDISNAGKRAGIAEGTRSGLWFSIADAVGVLRPRLVLLENVAAIVGRGLDRVLADLADLGFDAEWACVRASDVGAPHRRERWFLVAADADITRLEGREPARRRDMPTWGHKGAPADATGNGRNQGWPQPARLQWGSDVAVGGAPPTADPGSQRWHGGQDQQGAGRHAAVRDETRGDAGHGGGARPHAASDTDGDGPHRQADYACQGQLDPAGCDGRSEPGGRGTAWGDYEPAIRRWERLLGRGSSPPTDERGRLSPLFVEFLMGLLAGWVTDTPGLSRNDMLRILGNGVVPQQAASAYRHLLNLLIADMEAVA